MVLDHLLMEGRDLEVLDHLQEGRDLELLDSLLEGRDLEDLIILLVGREMEESQWLVNVMKPSLRQRQQAISPHHEEPSTAK